MQCQVLYHTDGTKSLQSKGFASVDEANKWMNSEGMGKSSYVQNARIVVDYAAVQVYQEMYTLMRDELFGESKKIKEKKII